jgi:hypothetical protein
MGARLRLRSKEAKGSTFTIEFPKTKPSLLWVNSKQRSYTLKMNPF